MNILKLVLMGILLFSFYKSYSQEDTLTPSSNQITSPDTGQKALPPSDILNQLNQNQIIQLKQLENQKNTKQSLEEKKSGVQEIQQQEEPQQQENLLTKKTLQEETSDLEENINKIYKDILQNRKLKQFGYEFFRVSQKALSPVSDDYVLGPGDNLKVYLWGDPVDILSIDRDLDLTVSRDGSVYIPNLGVMTVAGLKIADFKKILQQRLSGKFKNLKVDVVLNKLRTFKVYVTGFVKNPGQITVNPLDTLIDAITYAGGVSKSGTLRNIEIKRKTLDGLITYKVDLYDLFIKGIPTDIKLKEEDTIYVPPIGETVAISGDVKRPAIYELKSEKELKDILQFAGGLNPSASEVYIRISRFSKDGVNIYEGNLTDENFLKTKLQNGDFIFFGKKPNVIENAVLVKGDVYYPGYYSTSDTKTLKELLEKAKPKPNTDLVQVIREDKSQLNSKIEEVLEGKISFYLKPKDTVIVYTKFLSEPVYIFGELDNPKTIPYYPDLTLVEALRDLKFKEDLRKLKAIVIRGEDFEDILKKKKMSSLTDKDLTNDLQLQNRYQSVYLYDLLVKYDDTKNIKLYPGDVVIITKTYASEKAPSVTILGEVKHPGKYEITDSTTLAEIIKKAGGYTENAFPQGLIFIRESAKKLQKEKLEITMTTLEEEFIKSTKQLTYSNEEEKQAAMTALQEQKNLLQIMKKKAEFGLGRIALEIPPTIQELEKSNQNIRLEDNDLIIVPSRPSYVLVLGDVYNQVALPYIKGYKLKDYLEMVGGPGKNADKKNIYIIKSNGRVISAQSYGRSFLLWSGIEDYPLSEGDTIVVPSELKVPIMWRPLIKDVVQIIFQSISTAVLAKRL